MTRPSSLIHHRLSHHYSHSHLASARFGAGRCFGRAGWVWRTGRQRPSTSSQHLRLESGGVSRRDAAQDMPSSLHLEGDVRMTCSSCSSTFGASLSHGFTLVVPVDDMSCELEEILYHLLIKVNAISTPWDLSLCYMALHHLVIQERDVAPW